MRNSPKMNTDQTQIGKASDLICENLCKSLAEKL
jgi:hypothetical protein